MDTVFSLTACGVPEEAAEISSPVAEVTITEDQADICRESRVTWPAGASSLFIHPVTPYLVDSTIWAELRSDTPDDRPAIGSTRCVRWLVPLERNLDEYEKFLREQVQALLNSIDELVMESDRTRLSYAGIRSVLNPTLQSIAEEIAFKGALPAHYEETLGSILSSITEFHRNDHVLHKKAEELKREVTRVQREWILKVTRSAVTNRMAGLLVSFEAKSAGAGLLRCGYQVPCSQWRPQHEAHLFSEESAAFTTNGIVWQNTGEDWQDVTLTLSTAKPSLGLDAPLPNEDILQLREKTREERRQIRVEGRDQVIQSTGIGGPDQQEPPLPSDGGETQLYRVPEKVTIFSDGKPALIRLESFTMTASTAFTAIPEIDSHVFLVSEVKNARNRPILAGPAILLKGGSFIGYGSIDFTGPGETFHLWWGSEDLLRIERYVDEKTEDATLLAGKKLIRTITLRMRNLSGEGAAFTVRERVPVSELEQVRIRMKKPPEKATEPDKNGFIMIDADLGPREEKTIDYSYSIETDKDVSLGAL